MTSSCSAISGVGSVVGGTIKAAGGITGAVISTSGKIIGGIIGGKDGEIKAKNTKYKFSGSEVEITNGKTVVTGILTHNGITKRNLTIEVPCFDKNNAKVGDAVDNISSLSKNEKWEFQAIINTDEVKTTGIIAAVIEEAEAIKKEIENIKEIVINEISFFTGKFNEKEIVFVQSGIGKVNAAITATLLIEKFNVKEVIFSGVAGSLDARLKIGDVVIGRDIVQHDVDATAFGYKMGQIPQMKEWAFESDKDLIEKTAKINNINHQILLGRILTGDQFISKKDVKIQLGKDFDALCVDMESGAVAQVCARLGIKFLIIRSISDSITDDSGMEYTSFVKLAAENSKKILKEII